MSDLYAKQHIDSWKVSVCYNDQFLGAHMYLPNYVVAYSSLTACTTLITLTCCKLRISNHGVQGTTLFIWLHAHVLLFKLMSQCYV